MESVFEGRNCNANPVWTLESLRWARFRETTVRLCRVAEALCSAGLRDAGRQAGRHQTTHESEPIEPLVRHPGPLASGCTLSGSFTGTGRLHDWGQSGLVGEHLCLGQRTGNKVMGLVKNIEDVLGQAQFGNYI